MDKYMRRWDDDEQFRLQKALLGCTKESIGNRVGGAWYPLGPDDQMPDMVVGDTTTETPHLDKIDPDALEFLRARRLSLMRTTVAIQTPTVTLATAPLAAAS
ncbi:MAG: hypothetical protein GY768_22025, partial [Planctomycetaceae bacterium]|nr:hypothetical protein [Planctomycetaceae bacterium]